MVTFGSARLLGGGEFLSGAARTDPECLHPPSQAAPSPLCLRLVLGALSAPRAPIPAHRGGKQVGGDPNPWVVPGAGCSDPSLPTASLPGLQRWERRLSADGAAGGAVAFAGGVSDQGAAPGGAGPVPGPILPLPGLCPGCWWLRGCNRAGSVPPARAVPRTERGRKPGLCAWQPGWAQPAWQSEHAAGGARPRSGWQPGRVAGGCLASGGFGPLVSVLLLLLFVQAAPRQWRTAGREGMGWAHGLSPCPEHLLPVGSALLRAAG